MNEKDIQLNAGFDAKAGMRVESVRIEWITDENSDLSYLEQDYSREGTEDNELYQAQDKARLLAFQRGEWQMQGCIVSCEVSYPCGGSARRLQRFNSSGLWGIESDSDKDYLLETAAEQLADLIEHLQAFNVPVDNMKMDLILPEYAEMKRRAILKSQSELCAGMVQHLGGAK